jgi:hypothetical protein
VSGGVPTTPPRIWPFSITIEIEILCGRGREEGREGRKGEEGGGGTEQEEKGWEVDDLLILHSHVIANIPAAFPLCHDQGEVASWPVVESYAAGELWQVLSPKFWSTHGGDGIGSSAWNQL